MREFIRASLENASYFGFLNLPLDVFFEYCSKMEEMGMGNERLAKIEATFKAIDDNFDVVYAKAASDEEREMLSASRDAARDAFWAAVSSDLEKNSPVIAGITADLDVANEKLKQSLANLADVSVAIKAMEEAIRLAAALAALAA